MEKYKLSESNEYSNISVESLYLSQKWWKILVLFVSNFLLTSRLTKGLLLCVFLIKETSQSTDLVVLRSNKMSLSKQTDEWRSFVVTSRMNQKSFEQDFNTTHASFLYVQLSWKKKLLWLYFSLEYLLQFI